MIERAPADTEAARRRRALRVALLYMVLAALWILGSDWLVAVLVADEAWRMQISVVKGWVFVGATALLLYAAMRRQPAATPAPVVGSAVRPPRRGALLLACAAIAALTALAVRFEFVNHRADEADRLEKIATERAGQVAAWLKTRIGHVNFASGSVTWADLHARWADRADAGARDLLQRRLGAMRQALEIHSAALLDAEGHFVLGDAALDPVPAALSLAAGRAIASGQAQNTGLYADAARPMQVWLDVVVPLLGEGTRARAVVVMRSDASATLLQAIAPWPVDSPSGRTLLVQRNGDSLVGVHGTTPLPVNTPDLLVGRTIRGERPFGRADEALDFRGTPVLGAVLPVGDSGWYVVAKVDQREVRAGAVQHAAWIVAAGLLAMLAVLTGSFLLRERRALAAAHAMQLSQAERLRALALVKAIADGSTDAIFAKDNDGRYLLCNQAAADAIGRPVAEIIGRDDRALFPSGPAAMLMANDARVRDDDTLRTFEEAIATPTGPLIFLATKGPLHDEAGAVIGMFGISRDITERERQHQALQESEATKRLLLESMVDGMFVAQDHRFVFANAALPRMLGRDPEGFAGLPFDAVVAPESLALWNDRFEARVGDGPEPEGHYEVQFLHADGATRLWVDLRASRFELGGRRAVLGLVTDITERRRAAQDLADAAELLQAIEDSVLDHMAVLDRDGRITAVNEAWRRFARDNGGADTPLGSGDVGRNYLDACGSDATAREVAAGLRAVLDGRSAHFRHEYPCHGPGAVRWFQLNATPLRTQRGGAVVVHTDITELRRANDELDRHRHRLQDLVDAHTLRLQEANAELLLSRDRAEAANRTKTAFLANMSHEIRTPMNAIVGLAHLLRRDAHDPVQVERLRKVSEAAAHLLQVINDILDLSKIEAGKLELEDTDFSLSAVLAGARALVAERAQARGLELALASDGVPDALRGDPTRLAQALLNLLSNAVKFTDRGRVDVSVTEIGRESTPAGDRLHLRFAVRDTGIGIAADKLGALFSAFTQADTSTTRRFGGTGLGLAITQRLAAQMGGEVGVTSTPGVGSEFWFSARVGLGAPAPARLPAPPAGDAETALRRRAVGRRVLLVEDNPVNQDVARELLRIAGLQVAVASDGAEALAAVAREPHDLVLMDMQMPVMDGLEATRRLRALPACRRLPVIAMTANAFGEDRAACLAAGMDDHIAKPVDPSQLYTVLLRWLPEAPPAPPAAGSDGAPADETVPPVPGLDLAQALRFVGGRAAVLRRVLRQFADHYRDGLAGVREALAAGDNATAGRGAHSIKGAAASIAAERVPALADALERAIVQRVPAAERDAITTELQRELQALVRSIDGALVGGDAAAAAPAPLAAADLVRLSALLEAGDFDATTLFRRLRPALAARDAQATARIDGALAAYDFEQAAAVLQTLQAPKAAAGSA